VTPLAQYANVDDVTAAGL